MYIHQGDVACPIAHAKRALRPSVYPANGMCIRWTRANSGIQRTSTSDMSIKLTMHHLNIKICNCTQWRYKATRWCAPSVGIFPKLRYFTKKSSGNVRSRRHFVDVHALLGQARR